MKKTVKHTLIFGIGSVVNSAFGFVLVPLYTRKLRASEFGVLSLVTITLTLLTIVLKFGLNHAFFRHYYETEDPEHRRKIVGSTLIFLVLSSSTAAAVLWKAAPQISAAVFKGDDSRADLIQLVFLIAVFEVITLIPDSILRAKFKSARYSTLNIITFVFQIGLICYLVIWVDANVTNVLIGRLGGTAFEALLFYAMVARDLSLKFSARELRGMLAFGTPLIFGQIAFLLFMMIDRFFLEHYTNTREVGAYSMACTLVSAVSILVTVPFSQVWTVMRFSVMNEEGAEEYYARVLTYIVFVSMFLALGVSAAVGDGLTLYSLKSYWSAAVIIPLLGLSAVLDCASRVLNIGITLKKRTIFAPIVITVALAANVGLNLLLIPRYGSMGATISTLVSFILFCGLRYWASNLFFKVPYEWGRVFKILGVGAMLTAAFYLNDSLRGDVVPGDVPNRPVLLVSLAIKTTLALSFPLLLFVFRFYHERELHRIGEMWQKLNAALRRRVLPEAG
ncbi:MAG TPA: oligosaccharide flippase family protein [Blastocatellia bacterium]|nr:oligosaccharide flippase family protein [Blastocatellia bacterium]